MGVSGDEDVLPLYTSSTHALLLRYNQEASSLSTPIPLMNVKEADQSCNKMHINLTDHSGTFSTKLLYHIMHPFFLKNGYKSMAMAVLCMTKEH
jgi:hypothetical protein